MRHYTLMLALCGPVQDLGCHSNAGVNPQPAAGPLTEEAGRQLRPLAAQLTRLDLLGGHGRDGPTAPVEVRFRV